MTGEPVSCKRLVLGLAVAVAAISFAAIFIRLAQAEGMPSLTIAVWRLTFASAVLLPYAWRTRREEITHLTAKEVGLLAAAGTFLGLHFVTWITSLGHTSVASSVVLVTTGPVFVALGSWILLRERPGSRTAVGIGLALVGSVVISWADLERGGSEWLGNLLALTGAVMMAGYLMVGRRARASRSLVAYSGLVYTMAAGTLLIPAGLSGQPLFGFSAAAYLWVLVMALVSQLVGHSVLNWALRHLSATYVAMVTMAEPIGSSLLALLLFGEAVPASTMLGGALILVGIYVGSRRELTTRR